MAARVTARSILEVELKQVVLLIGEYGYGAILRRDGVGERLQLRAVGEQRLVADGARQQLLDNVARMSTPLDDLHVLAVRDQSLEPAHQLLAANRSAVHGQLPRLGGAANQERLEIAIVLDVGFALAALGTVERWLRDIHVAVVDQLRHLTV